MHFWQEIMGPDTFGSLSLSTGRAPYRKYLQQTDTVLCYVTNKNKNKILNITIGVNTSIKNLCSSLD